MMSAKAGKRPLRSLTAHEKLEAIRRVHDGESKASVARDIGVPESTLRGWCKNEEKISYISRQSSPETDDSIHASNYDPPKEKKAKLDDTPYNLSLKPTPNPRLSYSPGAESKYPVVDYSKTTQIDEKPLNLNLKSAEKTAIAERERNRAELARLSIELGLNRPEMYTPTTGNTLADLSSNINLLNQWNSLLLQQQKQCNKKITAAPADTNVTSSSQASQPLLTTYKPEKSSEKSPKLGKLEPPKSVDESVWYWLKTQQAMLNLTQNQTNLGLAGTSLPATTLPNDQNSSWFWKWYKQYTQASAQLHQQQQLSTLQQQQQPPAQDNKQILYQQLTKDNNKEVTSNHESCNNNSENLNVNFEDSGPVSPIQPKPIKPNGNKARAVLDNLLLNNNNNNTIAANHHDTDLDEDDLTEGEALEHGEKFLKYLECCSEPTVSAMQIMQFRGLIHNVKLAADRKNGDQQNLKAKVRRK